jgi:carbamoyl-phosphate synthase large subunit
MLDKAASATLSARHGLPYAATLATDTDAARLIDFAARHGYPLIAKPRQGFASRGVFLVQNDTQLARLAGRPDTILQRYLGDRAEVQAYLDGIARDGIPLFHSFEADKHSIQAFIAPDGSLKGLLATRHAMRQGRSERVARNDDPTLLQLGQHCAQAFTAEGWRGPLNIQCQRTPEGDYAIYEYNGRYTGATGARQLLGYDEVGMGLEHFAGIRLPESTAPHAWPDAVQRLPVSRAVEAGWAETLERTGHWQR